MHVGSKYRWLFNSLEKKMYVVRLLNCKLPNNDISHIIQKNKYEVYVHLLSCNQIFSDELHKGTLFSPKQDIVYVIILTCVQIFIIVTHHKGSASEKWSGSNVEWIVYARAEYCYSSHREAFLSGLLDASRILCNIALIYNNLI